MLLEKLIRLECSLHGDMRKDREWLEQILHKEFREITRTGVLVTRKETIECLSAEINAHTGVSSRDSRVERELDIKSKYGAV